MSLLGMLSFSSFCYEVDDEKKEKRNDRFFLSFLKKLSFYKACRFVKDLLRQPLVTDH